MPLDRTTKTPPPSPRAAGPGGERIEVVDPGFELVDSPEVQWRVRRYQLVEGLSRPYELRLELLTADVDADIDADIDAK